MKKSEIKKILKHMSCAYLYADGHLVIVYNEKLRNGAEAEYVRVIQDFVRVRQSNTPKHVELVRIVLHANIVRVILEQQCSEVDAWYDNSTDRTKELGFCLRTLVLRPKEYYTSDYGRDESLTFHYLPSICSGDFTLQYTDDTIVVGHETWEETSDYSWCGHKIVEKIASEAA